MLVVGIIAALVVPLSVGAQPELQVVTPGEVVALRDTPHLWIGGDDGALHWAGDTRALADRVVNWSSRREVSLGEIRSFRRGDPWLSAGLLKLGDPIYLVKWETSAPTPTLLHIQSIQDVELFGINANNYGAMVLDQATWERRFNLSVGTLGRGVLVSAVLPTATPTPAVTATPVNPLRAREVEIRRSGERDYTRSVENEIEITGAVPNTMVYVSLAYEEYLCSPSCNDTRKGNWGPIEAGRADSTGKLRWTDRHSAYKRYTYTFTNNNGLFTATLDFYDDL